MGDRWNSSNIQSSKHVWLPLSVRSGYPTVQWYDEWKLTVFDEMYRFKRLKEVADGTEFYLLEKFSNRLVSRPKTTLTLENDGKSNLCFVLHATGNPYTYKIEDKTQGKFLESVFGTTRWTEANDHTAQEWVFWLEEDGYYRIQNREDGVCLSVSGNATEAGTTIYMAEANKNVHQSFGLYFDSTTHPDYEEADMWGKTYREANRQAMAEQATTVGIKEIENGQWRMENGEWTVDNGQSSTFYDLAGRRLSRPHHGLYISQGRKIILK